MFYTSIRNESLTYTFRAVDALGAVVLLEHVVREAQAKVLDANVVTGVLNAVVVVVGSHFDGT